VARRWRREWRVRIGEEEGEGTFLDLGGLGEAHVVYALEQVGVAGAQR
jgi:hypothetical protein